MKPLDSLSDDELAAALRRAVALPDAPEALIHEAVGLWPQAAAHPASRLPEAARTVWRQVTAMLSFDSWAAAPLAHGMRSTSTAARHLLFSAEERDIDLRLTPQGQGFSLTGQVLGPDADGRIELATEGVTEGASDVLAPREAPLDALGEFRIEAVPPGRYRVRLWLGADEIVLPPIDVGP